MEINDFYFTQKIKLSSVEIYNLIKEIEEHLWSDIFWRKLMTVIRNKRLNWSINYRLAFFLKNYFSITREDLLEKDYIDNFLRKPDTFVVPSFFSKKLEPYYYLSQTKIFVKKGNLNKNEAIYFIKLIALFWEIKLI